MPLVSASYCCNSYLHYICDNGGFKEKEKEGGKGKGKKGKMLYFLQVFDSLDRGIILIAKSLVAQLVGTSGFKSILPKLLDYKNISY